MTLSFRKPKGGRISNGNSSTATLAGGAVFTGTGEDVTEYASVSVLYKSDVAAAASGLSIQFSQDNTNWDVQLVGDLGAKTFQVHALKPAARYFRVVYTNGSAAQSLFRLQCIFHAASPSVLISRAGQPQSTTDATPTRQTAEIDLDFARKHIPGGRSFFFFGHNDAVDQSYEDIYPGSGDINWQTTAAKIKVQSSDVTDDSGREVAKIVADSRTNTSDGQYLDITAQDGSLYRVYMDTTGGDLTQPSAGGRTLTKVDIFTGVADTATGSGDALAAVLDALSDFICPTTANGIIFCTDANAGTVTNIDIGTLGNAWAVSTDTAGATAGVGCHSVEVHGLSSTGADQDEVIFLNGTTAVESNLTYVRVNKMHNEEVGTYGGSHEGDVECRVTNATFSSGALLSVMVGEEGVAGDNPQYGLGEASNGFWTVPLGKVMYITHLTVNVQIGQNKTVDIILYEREGILNTSTPYDPRRIIWNAFGIEGVHDEEFKSHIKIKQLTDIWFRAKAGADGTRVDVKLHFYLLDRDASGA